jgi:hypothetical protein
MRFDAQQVFVGLLKKRSSSEVIDPKIDRD